MKLQKYTKAELISKLENIRKERLENSKLVENESDSKISNKSEVSINKNKNTSDQIFDILIKVRNLFLSLSVIAIFTRVFKNYKSVRAVLKLANYIVLAIFGISIFEAFGLGFLVKFFNELRYVFGGVIAYLTDTSFYNYMIKMFNVSDNDQSIRNNYKKPIEPNWKEEYQKAERKREWEKWLEKHPHKKDDDGIDSKLIILSILFLGGTIAIWYYGKDALDMVSPAVSLTSLIQRILRGGRDDDDNGDNVPIVLENPSERSISPDMLVYSSDNLTPNALNNDHLNNISPTPPAPPAPPAPPVPPTTSHGPPNSLLTEIEKGKKLKKVVTIVKGNTDLGNVISDIKPDKNVGMFEHLKNNLDKLRPVITGDDSELEISKSGDNWENSGETTPTNILDKGKGVERSISPDMLSYSSDSVKQDKKQKFLDSIKLDNDNKQTSSKIAPVLDRIKENFPNLSDETLAKLSTKEGLKNRHEIIANLSEDELKTNITPLKNFELKIDSFSKLNELSKAEREKFYKEIESIDIDELIDTVNTAPNVNATFINSILDRNVDAKIAKLVQDNPGSSKMQIVEQLIQDNPNNKIEILDIVNKGFMSQVDYMKFNLNPSQLAKFNKQLKKEDLEELKSLSEKRSIDQIRSLQATNRTHNNLLNEIKRKSSKNIVNENKFDEENNDNKFSDTNNLFD
jgi:hypothetical protein